MSLAKELQNEEESDLNDIQNKITLHVYEYFLKKDIITIQG